MNPLEGEQGPSALAMPSKKQMQKKTFSVSKQNKASWFLNLLARLGVFSAADEG